MKKKTKISLQELILRMLSRKRACKHGDIVEQIEVILEEHGDYDRKVKPKYVVNRTLKKMIDDEIVDQYDTEQSSFLSLTSSGRQKLRNIKLSSDSHLISTTWDGYWRMVIVDIPESRKKDQDAIRYILKKAQFMQLKSSVWITPYPLEHMMINMKKDMGLEEEIMVLVTNKLDHMTEQLLMEKFVSKKED
ncbi:MAG: DNA-binding transcriptional regulator PaaX [Candidatus Paceibacteria bacterium]|jgi:DNA-binding transcriptional regulator PaaX